MKVGDFEIGAEIGRGGMGVVYSAQQVSTGQSAVIKTLLPSATDAVLSARAVREGELLSSLEHPALVSVYASGIEAGRPWLAMERLEGQDLSRESIPVDDVQALCRELAPAASALALCHHAGMVHRDIKPANLFRDEVSGLVKLVDFGLARSDTGEGESLTMSGQITGTPEYMSPEQLGHRSEVGPASDIWSLGLSIYVLVSGDHPFRRGSQVATMKALMTVDPEPLDRLRDGLPRGLAVLVGRCLSRDPEARPAARELAEVLRQIGASQDPGKPIKESGVIGRIALAVVALALLLGLGKLGLLLTEPPRRLRPAEEALVVNDPEVLLKGEAERAGGRIKLILKGPDGRVRAPIFAAPDSRGRYAIPVTLDGDGDWLASLKLYGLFDRVESSESVSIKLDRVAPTLAIDRVVDGRVVVREVLSGQVSEALRALKANGRTVSVDRSGAFEIRDVAAGELELVAEDLAGNIATLSLTILTDVELAKAGDDWLLDKAHWESLEAPARTTLQRRVLSEGAAWLCDAERWSRLPRPIRQALVSSIQAYLGESFALKEERRLSIGGVERSIPVFRHKVLDLCLLLVPQDLDPGDTALGGCLILEQKVTGVAWDRVRLQRLTLPQSVQKSTPAIKPVGSGPLPLNANQGAAMDFFFLINRLNGLIGPADLRFPTEPEWVALFGESALIARAGYEMMPEWTNTLPNAEKIKKTQDNLKTLPRVLRGGEGGRLRLVSGPKDQPLGALRLIVRLPGKGRLRSRGERAKVFLGAIGRFRNKSNKGAKKFKLDPDAVRRSTRRSPKVPPRRGQ